MGDKKVSDSSDSANSIIKNHMIWSMGAGFIPVPIADFFAVSAIQLDMIRQLCKLYDVDFKETEGKAVITSLTGAGIARLGARAIKFIPGVGSVLGGVTLAVLSGGSTYALGEVSYALGEVFKKHFETGGTFLDFDPSRLKKYYDEKFEKGKEMARDIKKQQDKTDSKPAAAKMEEEIVEEVKTKVKDPIAQLQGLAQMKANGDITAEEFEILKKKVLDS